MDRYKYLIFDGSYYLMRQLSMAKYSINVVPIKKSDNSIVLSSDGNILFGNEFNFDYQDIVKTFYWSIIKYIRDYFNCGMPIVVFDKGPYHKLNYLDDYKSSRVYITQEDLDECNQDEDPEKYFYINQELYANHQKFKARKFIVNEFPKLGIPVLIHEGYEGDDLAFLFANKLENESERCGIVSIDSDWNYLINKNVDRLKPNGDTVLYSDVITELEGLDLSIYKYKSYIDSLYGSHNDLYKTIKPEFESDWINSIKDLESGKNDCLEDIKLFSSQLKSFNVYEYPQLDEVESEIDNILTNSILPIDIDEFIDFKDKTGFKVSLNYYKNALNYIDKTLYK